MEKWKSESRSFRLGPRKPWPEGRDDRRWEGREDGEVNSPLHDGIGRRGVRARNPALYSSLFIMSGDPLVALVLFFLSEAIGCGGGSSGPPPATGTPAGTYTLTVIGTSGTTTHTTTMTLIVNWDCGTQALAA